jgi:methylenetetrahydrofolate dehydrogenase (NADP+)/methenyltetrahydrofolate cyclohydrolase
MSAKILDGKKVAARVREDVTRDVAAFVERTGIKPGLATVLVGEDPASAVYVANKKKSTVAVGMNSIPHDLPADTSREDLLALIDDLNADPEVSGILCQLPVPDHLDGVEITNRIDPLKDVDGLTVASAGRLALHMDGLRPCTPEGCMLLIKEAGIDPKGLIAVVIGRSNLFGKPMAQMLLEANATTTICHRHTSDLELITRHADLLIAAVGQPLMVKGDWIKPGATVIDVGINRTDNGLVGDVDFDSAIGVAGAITPVPGGVGPMTIACLLGNTLKAAELQLAAKEATTA